MKVLEVYSKKDLDRLTVKGKTVSKIMNDFFKQFPSSYRENYDKNLETLEIWKVDEHYDGVNGGEYCDVYNVLMFRRYYSIIHELMHMASCDYTTRRSSFERNEKGALFEAALIEGFTEYLASCALNQPVDVYHFEVFTASMLANIDGMFEPYFIPSFEKFVGLFPNKKDIISLMYSLEAYSRKCDVLISSETGVDNAFMGGLERSVSGVIDGLIDIQLSRKLGYKENKKYANMFMDLISEENLNAYLSDFWEDYLDYANEQVKKRILGRK